MDTCEVASGEGGGNGLAYGEVLAMLQSVSGA